MAAQLTDSPVHGGPSRWLQPLPAIERAAAGVGHVNAQTEMDGVVRQVAIRLADDTGRAYRSMPVEAVRVADGTPEEGITDLQDSLLLGARTIRLDTAPPAVAIVPSTSTKVLHGGRMTIDYIGPAGSFNPVTYSLADVLAGRVPAEKFRGKFVLIGATAASLGDRVASPFVRYTDARADQHGALMPGVEVLANAIHVILTSRYYTETSDIAAFLWACTVALLTLVLLEWAQGGRDLLKQLGVLVGMAALVVLASYLAFLKLLLYPPMVACLVAFACAGLLALLRRSLVASARLDANIAELALSGDLLAPAGPGIPGPYHWAEGGPVSLSRGWLPKGLEWKARILSDLNARLLDRAKFVNFALRSVEDGLLIADPGGRITFANRSAGAILGVARARPRGPEPHPALARFGGRRNARPPGRRTRPHRARNRHPRRAPAAVHAARGGGLRRRKGRGPGARHRGFALRCHPAARTAADQERRHFAGLARNAHAADRHPGHDRTAGAYDLDPERRREMNLAINDEVKRLTRMITEYLDITRLETGATAMRLSPVRVEILVERILLLLDPVAGAAQIRLVRRFAADLPAVAGRCRPAFPRRRESGLERHQVQPDGTEVTISARAEEEISPSRSPTTATAFRPPISTRIFEKFYRVPRVQDADVPGTGLGLALVREIAELHGGSVSVRSEVNQGSTFTLRIPRSEARKESS